MTYTEKELDQFLHGISLSLLSKKSAQHWRYDEETAKEIEWLEALERKVRADKADRKTENSSEKPNNCEHITEDGVTCAKYPACDDCLDNPLNKIKGSERLVKGKDEPTISKMEQVETMSCAECKHRPIGAEICEEPCHYEPQTDWHYDEQDATWYPYKHEDEPQQKSCATCKHALGNWDGESNNCGRCCGADRRFYEPKDEQPERSSE